MLKIGKKIGGKRGISVKDFSRCLDNLVLDAFEITF
jgi:hypothetical protein